MGIAEYNEDTGVTIYQYSTQLKRRLKYTNRTTMQAMLLKVLKNEKNTDNIKTVLIKQFGYSGVKGS